MENIQAEMQSLGGSTNIISHELQSTTVNFLYQYNFSQTLNSLSLRFNGHFPGEPALAGIC